MAKLREANKRTARANSCVQKLQDENDQLKSKVIHLEELLANAELKQQQFMAVNSDWCPPDNFKLDESDADDAQKIFEQVDEDLDVETQMRLDPTGGLALF